MSELTDSRREVVEKTINGPGYPTGESYRLIAEELRALWAWADADIAYRNAYDDGHLGDEHDALFAMEVAHEDYCSGQLTADKEQGGAR